MLCQCVCVRECVNFALKCRQDTRMKAARFIPFMRPFRPRRTPDPFEETEKSNYPCVVAPCRGDLFLEEPCHPSAY
jgi:hypothetical protein